MFYLVSRLRKVNKTFPKSFRSKRQTLKFRATARALNTSRGLDKPHGLTDALALAFHAVDVLAGQLAWHPIVHVAVIALSAVPIKTLLKKHL